MKPKFTQGPWSLEKGVSPLSTSILDSNGDYVIAGEYDGYMTPFSCKEDIEAKANAYLVSTAPELYNILQEALDEEIAYERGERVYGKWIEKAKAVLAKARGENYASTNE